VGNGDVPTAFSSMICSALVFAAVMFAGLTEVERKKRRRNEMLGNVFWGFSWEWDVVIVI
jgi:hypothetical protein